MHFWSLQLHCTVQFQFNQSRLLVTAAAPHCPVSVQSIQTFGHCSCTALLFQFKQTQAGADAHLNEANKQDFGHHSHTALSCFSSIKQDFWSPQLHRTVQFQFNQAKFLVTSAALHCCFSSIKSGSSRHAPDASQQAGKSALLLHTSLSCTPPELGTPSAVYLIQAGPMNGRVS